MATYAIGDVQGCAGALRALLARLGFEPGRDRLWFAGDLVNRGPHSLAVLRLVRDLGEHAVAVLGNHDLHLLASASGARALKSRDTFGEVLSAPDRDELLGWLRRRPLLHHDPGHGYTLVHAGLAPQWTLDEARALAREVEERLRGDAPETLLRDLYGDEPACWSPLLRGIERHRFVVNALTRIRYVTPGGALDLCEAGPPGSQPAGLLPWFDAPGRRSRDARIVFGHWAALALPAPDGATRRVHHVDTGCVWGGRLSALRLEDRRLFSVPCRRRGAGR